MYKHLFVPVDGSELSARLMSTSIELALQLNAKITGFVVEPDLPLAVLSPSADRFTSEIQKHEAENKKHSEVLLEQFRVRAEEAGVEFVGRSVTAYSVSQSIVESAELEGCDMIVMITHGRGPIGEFIFGSQSQKIVAKSKLPVLVLH